MIGLRRKRGGSGVPEDVRFAVAHRDGPRCVACGRSIVNVPASVHHRLPRGRGGDARLSNLVTLCGSGTTGCHGEVESCRAQAYDDGLLVRSGGDPAGEAVLTWAGWRYFTDDGRVLTIAEFES